MKKGKPIPDSELAYDLEKLYNAVNQEKDYPCVLMAGSFVERCLDNALLRTFPNADKDFIREELLDFNRGDISTYASKNKMLFAMNVINSDFYHEIYNIGKIRNLFAHSHLEISFSDSEVQKCCNELELWKKPKPPFQIDEWNEQGNRVTPEICRAKFIDSALEIIRDFLGKGLIHKIVYHQDY